MMLRQVGSVLKLCRRNFVKRKYLTKDIFLKKHFDLAEVHAGNPNKLRVQEEYLQYTIKLEDPLGMVNIIILFYPIVKIKKTFCLICRS